ncbi:Non-catalytic module family DOC2, partial [Piromyces sp. E2]
SSSSCWATKLGYNCCSDPNTSVYYEDQDGQWGLENNNWCVIQKSSSSQVSCWSKALGFDCCSSCGPVYHTDNDGRWSVVDGKWCGLPSN